MAPDEEILGARADTANFVLLEEALGLVIGWLYLANLEEIEGFPLRFVVSFDINMV